MHRVKCIFNHRLQLLVLILLFTLHHAKAEKYALIFAIGNYPEPEKNGWPKISSHNDAEYLYSALQFQAFIPSKITLVADSMATRAGILKNLKELSNQIRQGDIVLIHFSCHGVQIEDPSELDGLTEAIVPYGARYSANPEDAASIMSDYITDDEIAAYINNISSKLGGRADFLVTFDVGFSGFSNSRSAIAGVRGGHLPITRGNLKTGVKDRNNFNSNNDNNLVFISACSGNEAAFETVSETGKSIGSLTYALSNALLRLNENVTYRQLFNQIEQFVTERNPYQHPEISTSIVDKVLFGGQINVAWPFVEVTDITDNNLQIAIGRTKGVGEGSVIEFYRSYQPQYAFNLLTRGVVIEATDFTCKVKIDTLLNLTSDKIWAFVKDVKYGSKKVRLKVTDDKLHAEIQKSITNFSNLILVETNPELILSPSTANTLNKNPAGDAGDKALLSSYDLLISSNGQKFITLVNSNSFFHDLDEELKSYGLKKFVKSLQNKKEGLNAEISFSYVKNGMIDLVRTNEQNATNHKVLYENDSIFLEIRNTGTKKAFVTILDIQPDNYINMILPNFRAELYARDLAMEPGEKLDLSDFLVSIGPPFGMETFKVILSEKPVDLSDVLTDGARSTRGGNLKPLVLEDYTIFDYNFEIRDRKFKPSQNKSENEDELLLYLADNQNRAISNKLSTKDELHVEAINPTSETIYYNLVSLDADQNVNVVFPNVSQPAILCEIKPNDKYKSDFLIKQPKTSAIKYFLFYSNAPFDLERSFSESDNKQTLLSQILVSGKIPNRSLQTLEYNTQYFQISDEKSELVTKAANDPVIEILTPQLTQNNLKGSSISAIKATYIDISGFASTENQDPVKEVRVNGLPMDYNAKRQFFKFENYPLKEGENKIIIEAITFDGLQLKKIMDIFIESSSGKSISLGKNYFVGIGINSYGCCGYDNLNNAKKDVLDFSELLKSRYGFEKENMMLLTDSLATRANIYRALRYLIPILDTNDRVIIYLSGHGNKDQMAVGGYFFIPTDVRKDELGLIDESSLLSEDDILKPFKSYRARHTLLLVDACYSGLIASGSDKGDNHTALVEELEREPSKWIITSGRAEKVSDGKPGANSPFASVMIGYLRNQRPESSISVSVLSNELKEKVSQLSNQTPLGKPFFGNGEFVFHAH